MQTILLPVDFEKAQLFLFDEVAFSFFGGVALQLHGRGHYRRLHSGRYVLIQANSKMSLFDVGKLGRVVQDDLEPLQSIPAYVIQVCRLGPQR